MHIVKWHKSHHFDFVKILSIENYGQFLLLFLFYSHVSVCQNTNYSFCTRYSFVIPLFISHVSVCQNTNYTFCTGSTFLMYFLMTCAGICHNYVTTLWSQILWCSDIPAHNFNRQFIQINECIECECGM